MTSRLTLALVCLSLLGREMAAQCHHHELERIHSIDGVAGDEFGHAIAVDGNWAVAGTYAHDACGADTGAAYVFRYDGANWVYNAKLVPSCRSGDFGGIGVAVSGNRIAVGVDQYGNGGRGYVSVFDWDGATWIKQPAILAHDGEVYDRFGFAVALQGNRLVAGAVNDDDAAEDAGAAYVYDFDGLNWNLVNKIVPTDGGKDDGFGVAVSLDGDAVLVGAHLNGPSGAAYVYRHDGSDVSFEQKLVNPSPRNGELFGRGVALDGDLALVGAYGGDHAYLFRFDGFQWSEEQEFRPSDASRGQYGLVVAIDGDVIVVGARSDSEFGEYVGAAYLYRFMGTHWGSEVKLVPRDPLIQQGLGSGAAVDGEHILVGGTGTWRGADPMGGTVFAFESPAVALRVDPEPPRAYPGVPVSVLTCGELAGGPVVLVVSDATGIHYTTFSGALDADGSWNLMGTVPLGLGGTTLYLQSLGLDRQGRVAASDREELIIHLGWK